MDEIICPDCGDDDLEIHFDGSQTWLLCMCGLDFLYGDGDRVKEIEDRQAKCNSSGVKN